MTVLGRLPATARVGIIVLFALGAGVPWILSSPPGASPDDDFHLVSVWCAAGDRCGDVDAPVALSVQRSLVEVSDCYRFDPTQSAACQLATLDWDDPAITVTERHNGSGLYPPLYYRSMHLLVTDSPLQSVIAMRAATMVLGLTLFGAVLWSSPLPLRQSLVSSWLLAAFPLGIFLLTSNNPSGWAIIGVGTFWAALINLLEPEARGSLALRSSLLVLSATLAAGSRADAATYILISIVAVAFVSPMWRAFIPTSRSRQELIVPGLTALIVTFSLIAFATASQGDVTTSGFSSGPERSFSFLVTENLQNLHVLHLGMIGVQWGLGWLDTAMPSVVGRSIGLVTAPLAVWGLLRSSWRKSAGVALVAAALVAVPIAILVRTSHVIPEAVQPRYVLPLYFLLLGLVMLPSDRQVRTLPLWACVAAATVMGVVNSVALHVNIRRYVTGVDRSGINLNADREWWWPGIPGPLFFWAVSTISMFMLAGLAMSLYRPHHRKEDAPELRS